MPMCATGRSFVIIVNTALAAVFITAAASRGEGGDYPMTYARNASSWDEQSGLERRYDRIDWEGNWGAYAVSVDNGDWFMFRALSFGAGMYDTIAIHAAVSAEMSEGTIEVRLDAVDGQVVASVSPGQTHCCFNFIYEPHAAPLGLVSGVHDLYFVVTGGDNICNLTAIELRGTMTAGPDDAKTYYVATTGDDANDGLSLEAPFRTIQHAAGVMKPGSKCLIRQGIYRETVTPAYNGVAGSPLTFEAYNNENVVVSGAEPITGWTHHDENIYKAPMDWDIGPGYNQIYVDGEAQFEARTPDAGLAIGGWDDEYATTVGDGSGSYMFNVVLKYCALGQNPDPQTRMTVATVGASRTGKAEQAFAGKPDDYYKGALFWSHGAWRPALGEIRGSRSSEGGVSFDICNWCWMGNFNWCYVSGLLKLLDSEREWALQDGQLYLWAPGGVDPSSLLVEAKKRILAFDLTAKSHVTIKNINIHAASITMRDADHCIIDGMQARYISHFTIWSPDFAWAGSDNSNGFKGIYVGGTDNTIRNSSIAYSAGSGVILQGDNPVISNCHIHHCNYSSTYDAAISCEGGGNSRVEYCDLHSVGRSCINNTATKVLYNKMHNGMLFSSEGGLIYTYGPGDFTYNGEEIAYNWFWDAMGSLAAAIVCDGGSRPNWIIHHNVIWRGANEVINPNNSCGELGTYNISYNNTFIDSVSMLHNWEHPQDNHNELYLWRGGNAQWKLADTAAMQFWPTKGSAAIDAGVTDIPDAVADGNVQVPGVTITDYQGDAPDIGAYEYGGERWTPGPDHEEPEWVYPPPDVSAIAPRASSPALRAASFRVRVRASRLHIAAPADAPYSATVYDLHGRQLRRGATRRGGVLMLDIGSLAAGNYVLRLAAASFEHKRTFMRLP
jgi:hypothetical protein